MFSEALSREITSACFYLFLTFTKTNNRRLPAKAAGSGSVSVNANIVTLSYLPP